MRTALVALVLGLALVMGGCLPKSYHCASNNDCGTAGVCESNGFCAYADQGCIGGLRYGDLSGSLAQQCVGDNQGIDGGIDGKPDGSSTVDTDGDGIVDSADNCPMIPNAGQENEDGDKFGDVC